MNTQSYDKGYEDGISGQNYNPAGHVVDEYSAGYAAGEAVYIKSVTNQRKNTK